MFSQYGRLDEGVDPRERRLRPAREQRDRPVLHRRRRLQPQIQPPLQLLTRAPVGDVLQPLEHPHAPQTLAVEMAIALAVLVEHPHRLSPRLCLRTGSEVHTGPPARGQGGSDEGSKRSSAFVRSSSCPGPARVAENGPVTHTREPAVPGDADAPTTGGEGEGLKREFSLWAIFCPGLRLHLADRRAVRDLRVLVPLGRAGDVVGLLRGARGAAPRGRRLRRARLPLAVRGQHLPVVAPPDPRDLRMVRRLGVHVDAHDHHGRGGVRRGRLRAGGVRPRSLRARNTAAGGDGLPPVRHADEHRLAEGAAGVHGRQHRRGGPGLHRHRDGAAVLPQRAAAVLGLRERRRRGGSRWLRLGRLFRRCGLHRLDLRRLRDRSVCGRGDARAAARRAEGHHPFADHGGRGRDLRVARPDPRHPRLRSGDQRRGGRSRRRHDQLPARLGHHQAAVRPLHHRLHREPPRHSDELLARDVGLRPRGRAAGVGDAQETVARRTAAGEHRADHRGDCGDSADLDTVRERLPDAHLDGHRRLLHLVRAPGRGGADREAAGSLGTGSLEPWPLQHAGGGRRVGVGGVRVLQHRLAARRGCALVPGLGGVRDDRDSRGARRGGLSLRAPEGPGCRRSPRSR